MCVCSCGMRCIHATMMVVQNCSVGRPSCLCAYSPRPCPVDRTYIANVVARSHRGLESSEIRRLKALTLLFQTVYRRAFTVSMVSFGAAMKLATKSMYGNEYMKASQHHMGPSSSQKLRDTPFESPARQLSIELSFASRGVDATERKGRI